MSMPIMVKPKQLQSGDKVMVVSPSFGAAALFPDRFRVGCEQLSEGLGVEVVSARHAREDPAWLSSRPEARAEDLIEALEDQSVKMIITAIGGDDSIRVNTKIPLGTIKKNPKIFMGYSDATTTHFWFLKAGVTSFYGPTIMAGFGENGGLSSYMLDGVKRVLHHDRFRSPICPNAEGWTTEFLDWADPENQKIKRKLNPPDGPVLLQGAGKVQGRFIGGCVEVLEMMRGTTYWPSIEWFDGALLFLETAEKEFSPTYFGRALRSLGCLGIFEKVNAILLGRPGGNLEPSLFSKYENAVLRVVRDEFGRKELPILARMDFGHTDPIFSLPYGVRAELDCDKATLVLLEASVAE